MTASDVTRSGLSRRAVLAGSAGLSLAFALGFDPGAEAPCPSTWW